MTECEALAEEIERRKLKFADIKAGAYEMLSEHEIELVCSALRHNGEEPQGK